MSVAVAYLARGHGAGLSAAEAFFESYQRHPAGWDHSLYVIAKGWQENADRDKLAKLVVFHGAQLIDLPDDGFDLGAYFRFAESAKEQWLCFLNSHSHIERENWLGLLMVSAVSADVGMAGCTGSFGTPVPVMRFILPTISEEWAARGLVMATITLIISYPLSLLHYLSKFRNFPSFPNPHLRTNAFVISSALFRDFRNARSIPRNKIDAFKLESGYLGLSRFVFDRGLRCLVIDATGGAHERTAWQSSQTFRTPGQTRLLIGDNQTRTYADGSVRHRRMVELSAWGVFLTER